MAAQDQVKQRIERYKLELFEHLKHVAERSIWELYTLCEYDSNPQQTIEASTLLQAASEDFAQARGQPARAAFPPFPMRTAPSNAPPSPRVIPNPPPRS